MMWFGFPILPNPSHRQTAMTVLPSFLSSPVCFVVLHCSPLELLHLQIFFIRLTSRTFFCGVGFHWPPVMFLMTQENKCWPVSQMNHGRMKQITCLLRGRRHTVQTQSLDLNVCEWKQKSHPTSLLLCLSFCTTSLQIPSLHCLLLIVMILHLFCPQIKAPQHTGLTAAAAQNFMLDE